MFEDLMKSFKAAMYERMSSPFLSSMIVFFVYFNWKAILVLFLGEDPIELRIIELESTYTDKNNNFYYPLCYAFVFSTAYPFASLIFFGIQNYAVTLKRKLRDWIEKNMTVSVEKYLEIKTEIIKHKEEFNALLETKDDEIQKLSERIGESSKKEADLNVLIDNLRNSLGNEQKIFGKQYGKFKKLAPAIMAEMTNQLKTDVTRSIASFWSNQLRPNFGVITDGGRLNDYGNNIHCLRVWNEMIAERASRDNYGGIVDEYGALISQFVNIAENIRIDAKKILESNRADNSNFTHSSPDQIREQWNQAREAANDTIDRWLRLLADCLVADDKSQSRQNLNKISSIGDPVVTKRKGMIAKATLKNKDGEYQ